MFNLQQYQPIADLFVPSDTTFSEFIKLDTCSICYNNISNIITNCNHQYCKDCFEYWIETGHTLCPYCNQHIDINQCTLITN